MRPGLGAARRQLPELLDAEPVGLRLPAVGEAEARDELLGHAAAAALREDRRAGADVGARRVVRPRLALAVEAHVADAHARRRGRPPRAPARAAKPGNTSTPSASARAARSGASWPRETMKLPRLCICGGVGRRSPAGLREVPELVARRRHADVQRRLAPARQQRVERARARARSRRSAARRSRKPSRARRRLVSGFSSL